MKFLVHLGMKSLPVSIKESVRFGFSGNMQPTQLPACFSVSLLLGSVVGLKPVVFSASSSTGSGGKSSNMSCRAGDGGHCLPHLRFGFIFVLCTAIRVKLLLAMKFLFSVLQRSKSMYKDSHTNKGREMRNSAGLKIKYNLILYIYIY